MVYFASAWKSHSTVACILEYIVGMEVGSLYKYPRIRLSSPSYTGKGSLVVIVVNSFLMPLFFLDPYDGESAAWPLKLPRLTGGHYIDES